jgi:hypothetical protein
MFHRIGLPMVAAAACLLAIQACRDNPLQVTGTGPDVSAQAVGSPADSSVALIARAFARAITVPEMRQRVLEDLRDSPFPDHALQLKSYLQGQRGRAIAEAAASATGLGAEEFLELVRAVPHSLALGMRVPYDRARWAGSDDLLVLGTTLDLDDLTYHTRLTAYTLDGRPVTFVAGEPRPEYVLDISTSSYDFGADPEARRMNAPRRNRSTISTREEEFERSRRRGERNRIGTADVPVDSNPPPPSYYPDPTTEGYDLGFDYFLTGCRQTGSDLDYHARDLDRDGLRDECEHKIAFAFRPLLHFGRDETLRSRESRWAVVPAGDDLRIFYALGYHTDSGHNGDSEFIWIEVSFHSYPPYGRWKLDGAYLSAHEGAYFERSEWNFHDGIPFYVNSYRGRPKIWVGENKHGNFESADRCNHNRLFTIDECDTPLSAIESVEVLADDNLGNHSNRGFRELLGTPRCGLFGTCTVDSRQGKPGTERYWDPTMVFMGWHLSGGSSPYENHLWKWFQ